MGKYLQGLTKKWHGLPIWAWAAIVGLVLYLGYRWYSSRNSSSSSNATPSTAAASAQTPDTSGGYPLASGDGGGSSFIPPQTDQPLTGNNTSGGYPFGGGFGLSGSRFEIPSSPPQIIVNNIQPKTNATKTAAVKAPNSQLIQPKTAAASKVVIPASIKSTPLTKAQIEAYVPPAGEQQLHAEEGTHTTVPAKAPVTAKTTPAPVASKPSPVPVGTSGYSAKSKNTSLH